MKFLRKSIFLPVFGIVAFLGLGAGTLLADSSNEGVGGWKPEPVGTGQITWSTPSNLAGIDGSGEARFTSQATSSEPKRRAFVGTLAMHGYAITAADGTPGIAVDSITVSIQSPEGDEAVNINLPTAVEVAEDGSLYGDGSVDGHPYIKTPGGPRAGKFENDARVVVLAEQIGETHAETEGETDWDAVWILIKPVRPDVPLNGVVVEVDGDEVTVETPDGDTETVTLPEGAAAVAHGEVITVFPGQFGQSQRDGSGKAKGMVRAEEVKNRLKKFLDDAEDVVDGAEEGEEGKGNDHDKAGAKAERIADFLERVNQRQERMLARTIDRASNRANIARLEEVRERIRSQREEHQEAIGRIRTKLDRIHPQHSHRGGTVASDDHRPDGSNSGRPDGNDHSRPDQAVPAQDGEHPTSDEARGRNRGRSHRDGGDTATP